MFYVSSGLFYYFLTTSLKTESRISINDYHEALKLALDKIQGNLELYHVNSRHKVYFALSLNDSLVNLTRKSFSFMIRRFNTSY